MSAITTLLTTAVVTVGVIKVAQHLRRHLAEAEQALDEVRRKQTTQEDLNVLDFSMNPETGVYEPQA